MACKRVRTREEVEQELSNSMLTYLWNTHNKDTSNLKFQIKQVYFYEEATHYDCQFMVRMHNLSPAYDTTGAMKATVSKDFSTVKRQY